MRQMKSNRLLKTLVRSLGIFLFFLPGFALSQTPFYVGKTITIIQGRSPGGFGDMRVKALIPFLQKYVPGNPAIVAEYMPGAGGRKAANYIFRVARPDGLTIGNAGAGLVTNAVLGEPGVEYDLDKLVYLGSPDGALYQSVFVTRKEVGLDNLARLRAAANLRIGSVSVGHSTYNEGRLFAYFLDLKEPKFVTGYSGPEIDMALARGEVDARTQSIDNLLQRSSDWIEKGLMNPHAVFEVPKGNKHPRFSHLPEIETFARSDRERKVLAMLRAFRIAGAPLFLLPGTPKDRVEILREGLRKTFRDPAFLKEYKKLTGDDPVPLLPEECEKTVAELPRDSEAVELFKRFVGADALPAR
jgi:tripartite-type tricarboxylate transporter receptor subunit TctC